VVTLKSIAIRQEDIFMVLKPILISSAITVVLLCLLIIFLNRLIQLSKSNMLWRNLKKGHAGGKNFVVEEPELKFETPKFKPKLDLPKASENADSKTISRKEKTRS
jgi:hypothetical protein